MSATVLPFRRKPRTLAERFIERRREAKTAELRAQLTPATCDYLTEFVAGMELEQRFAGVMLNIEERV